MIEIIYDHRMPLRDSAIRHFIIHKGTIILLSHTRRFVHAFLTGKFYSLKISVTFSVTESKDF